MANRFLSNIRINDAYTFPASDGSNGQVIVTDGSGNLAFANPATSSSASIIYRDNFTGDGSTVAFTLQNSLSDEDQTFIYIDGVYQEKGTYSLSTNTITFTTAPDTGHSIEVISVSGINVGPTTIYQDNFTGDGTTTNFTLAQVIDNEVKTMIYFNGVYQFKGTYSLNGTALSFDTAPANGVNIEVISIASAAAADYNQKVLFYGKATQAISKGDAIMLGGQEGDHFLLSKATQTAIAANHEYFLGLASQDLAQGEFGYVTEFGKITELNTSGYTAGDILWFDAGGSTAGALTTTEPAPPLVKIQVAAVIRSHQNEGVLFIRPSWYHELGELHDVNVTSVADKDMLVWDNANGYWENTKALGDITATSLDVSGNLTVDSNTLYVDAANNKVGIGTTSFSTFDKVRITGTNTVANDLVLATPNTAQSRIFFSDTDAEGVGELGYDHASNAMRIVTNGSEHLRIDSNGNVGIGGAPTHKLYVRNDVAATTDLDPTSIKLYNNSDGGAAIEFSNGVAGNSKISLGVESTGAGTDDSYIGFSTSANGATASEKMRINSSGNVGIGTPTSPGTNGGGLAIYKSDYPRLTFRNSTTGDGLTDGTQFVGVGSNFEIYNREVGDLYFGTSDIERMRIDSNGRVGIGGSPLASARLSVRGLTNTSADYAFEAANSSGNSILLVRSDGNVGIGTTSPSAKIDVYKGSSGVVANFNGVNAYGAETGITLSQSRAKISGFLNTTGSTPGSNLVFYTMPNGGSVTERMRVTSSGQLQLPYGNASALNAGEGVITDPGTFTGMKLYGSSDGNLKIFNVRNNSSFGNILFYTGTGTERMRVGYNGNIGIATDAPDYGLDVQTTLRMRDVGQVIGFDTTGSANSVQLYTANDYEFHIVNSRGNSSKLLLGNTNISLGTSSIPLLFIDTSNGNVGIGTTSPTTGKLVVHSGDIEVRDSTGNTGGRIKAFDNYHAIYFREGAQNRTNYYQYGGTLSAGLGHRFLTGGTSQSLRMQIADDGIYMANKVGIGTTSPSQKFVVYETGSDTYVADFSSVNAASFVNIGNSSNNSYANIGLENDLGTAQMWHAGSSYGSSWGGNNSFNFYTPSVGFHWHPGGSANAMVLTTNRRLGINKTNPDYTLDVEGQAAFTDVILARSGTSSLTNADHWYQGKFTGSGSVHLKTSIGWGANTQMYSFHFLGHEYGSSKPIDAMLCFYNYPPQSTPIAIGTSGTHAISIYQSSDGYIVFRLALNSGYYTGFTISSRNTAQGLAYPSITATAQNTSSTHF